MAKQWAIQSVPGRTPDWISNNDEKMDLYRKIVLGLQVPRFRISGGNISP